MSYKRLNKRTDDLDIEELENPPKRDYSLEEESYKSGDKPRSILKDNPSATKGNKRIVINENANELHSISKVTSNTSAEKEKETASFRGAFDSKNYSQTDSAGYSPLSKSENSRSGNKYDKYELSDDEGQDKIDYKVDSLKNYAREQISNSIGKKSNISENSVSNEFQKAHIRKLQQERESELYGKFLKNSAQKVREKWMEEKQKSTPKSHGQQTDQSKGLGDYSGKSLSNVQSNDTYSKFSRIENKISDLEKDLESYQKTMKDKYDREQASQDDFEKAYNRVDSKVKILKKELDKSLDRYESRQYEDSKLKQTRTEEDDQDDQEEEEEEEEEEETVQASKGSKRSNLKKSVEFSHAEERVSSKASPRQKKTSSAVKSLKKITTEYDDELKRLRQENETLKRALKGKDQNSSKKLTRPVSAAKASTKIAIESKIEKERELLKTLDRLKRKVWKNISKKVKDEKDKENAKLKEEIEAKTFGRTYVPAPAYGTTYHDVLLTKIYGDTKARKANASLLHRGIPVTHGSSKWK